MKKTDSSPLAELLKLGETAFSALLGASQDIRSHAADSRELLVRKLDLITRDEFDAMMATIKKTREIQDDLARRISKLEGKSTLSSPQKRKTKKQIRRTT